MAYWGSSSTENDFAFDGVGAYIYLIRERMFEDAESVIEDEYPEQSIIASLQCLRLLASRFPNNVRVSFGKHEFAKAKECFFKWYDSVHKKIPKKYREDILANAKAEFKLFELEVLHLPKSEN
ncbi:hypothetical protein [Bremerella sp.]|uniref:hypothetical protein n=1 Tax=Bremerella sp. TaxID=2795602 RepID=UPI00391CD03C